MKKVQLIKSILGGTLIAAASVLTSCTLDGETATTDNLFEGADTSTAATQESQPAATDSASNDSDSSAEARSDTSSSSSESTASQSQDDSASTAQEQQQQEQQQEPQTVQAQAPEPQQAAEPQQSSGGGGGGFVWKPVSEGDGNLVVLTPPSSGATSMTISGPFGSENGRYTGRTNGNRPTFRFSRPGCGYGNGIQVSTNSGDFYNIPSGCTRYDF